MLNVHIRKNPMGKKYIYYKMENADTIGQRQFNFTISSNLTLMDH